MSGQQFRGTAEDNRTRVVNVELAGCHRKTVAVTIMKEVVGNRFGRKPQATTMAVMMMHTLSLRPSKWFKWNLARLQRRRSGHMPDWVSVDIT